MSEKFQTVSFDLYSSVMGITGLGLVWRAAAKTYGVTALPGEAFLATGLAVFLILTGIQLLRLIFCRQTILAEWHSRASKNFFCAATISGFHYQLLVKPDVKTSAVQAGARFSNQ